MATRKTQYTPNIVKREACNGVVMDTFENGHVAVHSDYDNASVIDPDALANSVKTMSGPIQSLAACGEEALKGLCEKLTSGRVTKPLTVTKPTIGYSGPTWTMPKYTMSSSPTINEEIINLKVRALDFASRCMAGDEYPLENGVIVVTDVSAIIRLTNSWSIHAMFWEKDIGNMDEAFISINLPIIDKDTDIIPLALLADEANKMLDEAEKIKAEREAKSGATK